MNQTSIPSTDTQVLADFFSRLSTSTSSSTPMDVITLMNGFLTKIDNLETRVQKLEHDCYCYTATPTEKIPTQTTRNGSKNFQSLINYYETNKDNLTDDEYLLFHKEKLVARTRFIEEANKLWGETEQTVFDWDLIQIGELKTYLYNASQMSS